MLTFQTHYHIYNHANGDDKLFREAKNYLFFIEKYHKHIDPVAETLAWCLMPNHFHLLIKIKSEAEIASTLPKFQTLGEFAKSKFISKQFANFFSSYTQAYNKVYGRRGSLFIKNFKRKEILDEDYLRNLILYIHLNPVNHGFTKNINDWKHTSFDAFPKLNTQLLTGLFGDFTNYKFMHCSKDSDFSKYEDLENDLT